MYRIFLLFVFIPSTIYSQINESFNDGNFNANPNWGGDISHFIINASNQLQLNATEAGISYLTCPSEAIENASWEFQLQMAFNPSSGNLARIYLASDHADLTQTSNGVFVEVGNTQDHVCLYKIENGTKEVIITGATDRVDLASVDIKIRVQRVNNQWLLQSNIGSGYIDEGTAIYKPDFTSSYFGVYCKYTSTRKNKFFFDNIIVSGNPYINKTPPEITLFEVLNGSTIKLSFNKLLDQTSFLPGCFTLKSNGHSPIDLNWNESNKTITLHYSSDTHYETNDTLMVSQIKDLDGNTMTDSSLAFSYERIQLLKFILINSHTLELHFSKPIPDANFNDAKLSINNRENQITLTTDLNMQLIYQLQFEHDLLEKESHAFTLTGLYDAVGDEVLGITANLSYYIPKRFDIVINEVMVDPTPSMGLPETEYIELYNNTDQTIDVNDWILQVNAKSTTLPQTEIRPTEYVVLVPSSSLKQWQNQTKVQAIGSWPALTNTSCDIILYQTDKQIMDAYRFNRNQINGEPFKADGGWSVERMDANNVSGELNNFYWSINLSGGTPGGINSIAADNTDLNTPLLESIEQHGDSMLQINFSETMDLFNTIDLSINPEPGEMTIIKDTVFLRYLNIHFHEPLPTNQIFQLNSIRLFDYANHELVLDKPLKFGVADSLMAGDILINEVLFNPYPDGVDFVELYNHSNKIIDIADIYLAEMDGDQIKKLNTSSEEHRLFMPQSFIALTSNPIMIQKHYHCKNIDALIKAKSMPTLPNDEGTVTVTNYKGQLMDSFSYSDQMHFDLINDTEGISLERLSYFQPTNAASNWVSAASTLGYATPTYENSQSATVQNKSIKTFSVSPEIFTPNGNGITDRLKIHYNTSEVGGMVTIRIFDSNGHEVRYLANNQSLANKGYFIWDGLGDYGEILRPAIYIIYIQCHYPSGKVIEEKLSCIIGVDRAD